MKVLPCPRAGRALALAFLGGILLAGSRPTSAADLPAMSGDLSGTVRLPKLSDVPPLIWHLQAATAADNGWPWVATVSGPGLELAIGVRLPSEDEEGSWELERSTMNLADWWGAISAQAAPLGLPEDLKVSGAVTASGNGTWQGMRFSGNVTVRLTDASLASASEAWNISGLNLTSDWILRDGKPLLQSASLTADSAGWGRLTGHDLELKGEARDPEGTLRIDTAQVDVLGGRIALEPFDLNPSDPAVLANARLSAISLEQLGGLVPQALQEASGQIAGRVAVNWSAKIGTQAGGGTLLASPGSAAEIRLKDSPGLLTGNMPERLTFLPKKLGPLADLISSDNPAYETLHRIETGQLSLLIETVNVQFLPDGPGGPRTLSVEMLAHPGPGSPVEANVRFTVNVAGPLDEVLNLGMSDRTRIEFASPP